MADIAVIIPVGPLHTEIWTQAVYSVLIQTVDFQVVVVNDSGVDLDPRNLPVTLVECNARNVSTARNLGAAHSASEALVFLDADDLLVPGALQVLWLVYKQTGNIVYGNLIRSDTGMIQPFSPQYCGPQLKDTVLYAPKRMPTHLVPREVFEAVGGFDPNCPIREDIEFEMACDVAGYCAEKVEYPIYFYNMATGERRMLDSQDPAGFQYVRVKYSDYYEGEKIMGCGGGCGDKVSPSTTAARLKASQNDPNVNQMLQSSILEIEYLGDSPVRSYMGASGSGRRYRFGRSTSGRYRTKRVGFGEDEVHPDDAQALIGYLVAGQGRVFRINRVGTKDPTVLKVPPKREVVPPDPVADDLAQAVIWGMDASKLKVEEIKQYAEGAPTEILERWLDQEREGQSRVTAIDALEKAIASVDA